MDNNEKKDIETVEITDLEGIDFSNLKPGDTIEGTGIFEGMTFEIVAADEEYDAKCISMHKNENNEE